MSIRDYGFGDPTEFIVGPPRIIGQAQPIVGVPPVCPACGCQTIYEVQVDLKDFPGLAPGRQVGMYLGCAACPFASPMIASVSRE
jgi:hypothetical protein